MVKPYLGIYIYWVFVGPEMEPCMLLVDIFSLAIVSVCSSAVY